MTQEDPYRVLGVHRGASADEIRAAFRASVRRQHPDTAGADNTDDAATRRVIAAYRLLADPVSRARYDASHPDFAVEHHRAKSGSQSTSPCDQCRGSGRVRTVATCPACGGRAEVTVVTHDHAGVLHCRACRGGGRVSTDAGCPACGGRGWLGAPPIRPGRSPTPR